MNRVEIKSNAKSRIKGQWFSMFVINLVMILVSSVIMIFGIPFEIAVLRNDLRVYAGQKSDYNTLKEPFDDFNKFFKYLGLILLTSIYAFLWGLLLIIPGIIKSYSYSAAKYLFMSDSNQKITWYIDESRRIMDGHKSEKFVFDLSFILHFLLVIVTLGIYLIYLIPYIGTSNAGYYTILLGGTEFEPVDEYDDIADEDIKIKTDDEWK